ncbi:MAG: hypothetical protein GXY97_01700 [Clostridiales bacterium]|jgi:uncharacterized protein|nr:hypothetical protein [Clostridiales bacterium]
MIIHVNRLRRGDDGRMTFSLKEDMEGLDYRGERLDFESPVAVNGSIERDGDLLYVTGEVRTEVVLQCSRCLRTIRHPLRTGFSQQYSEAGPGEEVLPVKGDSIDLREPVMESILLELPVKVLCSEECKGLCPICGADRNVEECGCSINEIDPRMQQLKRLLEQ